MFLFSAKVSSYKTMAWSADNCDENKDFTVSANQRTLLGLRNAEKNLKNNSKNINFRNWPKLHEALSQQGIVIAEYF